MTWLIPLPTKPLTLSDLRGSLQTAYNSMGKFLRQLFIFEPLGLNFFQFIPCKLKKFILKFVNVNKYGNLAVVHVLITITAW